MSEHEEDRLVEKIRQVFLEGYEAVIAPRFDGLDERIDKLETRVMTLESGQAETNRRLSALESSQRETNRRLNSLETVSQKTLDRLECIENDIQSIYELISDIQKGDKSFRKKDVEQKILHAYKLVLSVAEEAGVQLP